MNERYLIKVNTLEWRVKTQNIPKLCSRSLWMPPILIAYIFGPLAFKPGQTPVTVVIEPCMARSRPRPKLFIQYSHITIQYSM